MPVVKDSGNGACCKGSMWCGCHGWDFAKKILLTLAGVFLVYLIFYLGTVVRNNIKQYAYIGQADKMERTITVNGYGKVNAVNNIAVTTIGYSNVDADVAKAQLENKRVMDQVVAELKKLKIEDKDLQSDYTIYPEYNYTQDKGQVLKGYRVNNQMTIKIRDLTQITDVLNLAGKFGATEVGGLNFTIDDTENLKAQAREKALTDAKAKAAALAQNLGLQIGSVVSYNEYEDGSNDMYTVKSSLGAEGGGAGYAPAPEAVSAGSKDVIMNVNITYEISPAYSYDRW